MAKKKQEMTMEELREQMQAMLAQAKAEAAALVENARAEAARIAAEAKGAPVGMSAEERAAYEAYMNEEVEVKLFRDNDKYKDPVFVGCNGENVVIQRGVKVKIKRKFAEILDHSELQDYETTELIKQMTGKAETPE